MSELDVPTGSSPPPRRPAGRSGPRGYGVADQPRLVGRTRELAALTQVLADAAAGRGGVAVVEGEAGVGKSRLLQEALAQRSPAVAVLTAEADELLRGRPFGVLAQAFASAASQPAAVGVLRAWTAASAEADQEDSGWRFRATEEVVGALETLAQDDAVLLVLEDVHWADSASLLTLGQLARRARHLPVTAVVTCRPSPRPADLDRLLDLVDDHGGCHLRLARLPVGDVADLCEAVTGSTPGTSLLAAIERAAGNPLYCLELLAALAESDAIVHRDGRAELDAFTLPSRLRKLIARRLRTLPTDTRHLLRTASVLGTSFALDDLAVMLGQPASDLLRTLAETLTSGIIGEADDRLRFRHTLVRDACYAELPGAARRALHLQAARAFADAGRPPGQVARHYLLGASPGDQDAIGWLSRAGRQASARAPEVAVELLDAALALGGDRGEDRDILRAERGMALMWSGRVAEGEAALRALLARPHDPTVDAPSRLALGQSLLIQARAGDAAEVLESSMQRPQLSASDHARLLAEAALARLVSADIATAEETGTRARQAAEHASDAAALCVALSVLAAVRGLRGHTNAGLALAESAVEAALASPSRDVGRRPPHLFLSGLLLELDQLEEAEKAVQTARRTSEDSGAVWALPVAHILSARGHFHAGDLTDAEAELEAALGQAEEVGTLVLRVWAQAMRAHIFILRDQLAAAEEAMEAGERDLAVYGVQVQGTDWLVWARALWAEARGDADTALAVLRAVWQGHAAYGICSERRLLGPDYVRLCLQAGERDEAGQIAAAVQEAADLNGSGSARVAALRCRGLADADVDLLLEAVEVSRDAPRRLDHAMACEEAAGLLAEAGHSEQARTLLTEALALVEPRGAARAAGRIEASLRTLGVRRGRRGPRRRPATGWEALTDTERRVTDLVAEGLTNPQVGARLFISRRTVETHLSHVFAKLGVSSRVELAALAAAQGR